MTDLPIRPDEEDDALAAEYVLGLLAAEERERCALRELGDPGFAALATAWRARLAPLDATYRPVTPPAALRGRIETRLFGAETRRGLWSSLAFWRGLAAAALAASIVFATLPGRESPSDQMLATMAGADGALQVVAVYDRMTAVLRLNHVSGDPAPGRDLELWVIAGENPPASLGLVSTAGLSELVIPEGLRPHFSGDYALAISDEPLGGSATGAPTGTVLAVGPAVAI